MEQNRWQEIKKLFDSALRLDREKREAYLQEACGHDPEIRARVESLLAADEDASSSDFMETRPITGESVEEGGEELIGTRIGQYRIKSIISSGGMGTVYEGEQETPQRIVAVKVLKKGLDSSSAQKRFEYESQILARLSHPNIAQVYEAGRHRLEGPGGRDLPYFAMEFIPDALPITRHVREKQLTRDQRIELFLQVCSAVRYGNQKGIIHRDLKPGNILVDGAGRVKVIDFGVARATDADMQLTTIRTELGQIIGTLQYMSPEQCKGDPHDVDVRSDVYSLGVVLYEMLLDQLPYDVGKTTVFEATRLIREEPPRRPSALNRALKGDLETILLASLEKEQDRRYQTAGDLADDLERYRRSDLILARPAGPVVRFIKAVKRQPVISTGVGVGLLLLMVFFLYVVFVSYPRLLEEQRRTQAALKTAGDRAAEKEEINRFFEEMLSAPHPFEEGKDVKVVEVLDQAAQRIDGAFPDQPGVKASLHSTIGKSYLELGLYEKAEHHLREADRIYEDRSGEHIEEILNIKDRLSEVLKNLDQLDESEGLSLAAYEGYRNLHGESHPVTLSIMGNYAKVLMTMERFTETEALLTELLDLSHDGLGEDHLITLDAMSNLAVVKQEQGDRTGAKALLLEVYDRQSALFGKNYSHTLTTMNHLALLLGELGEDAEAEDLFREIVEVRRSVQGEDHPETLKQMNNLAIPLARQGKTAEAAEIHREILEIRRRSLGNEHRETITSIMNLALQRMNLGEYDESEILYREALDLFETLGQNRSLNFIANSLNLAVLLRRQNKLEEAESLLRKLLSDFENRLGEDHTYILFARNNLGLVLEEQGRLSEAEEIQCELLRVRRNQLGEDHPDTLKTMNNLGVVYLSLGKLEEAESLFRTMHELSSAKQGEDHPDTMRVLHNLALLASKRDEVDKAEALYRNVVRLRTAALGLDHPDTLDVRHNLAGILLLRNKPAEAEAIYLKVLEARLERLGPDHAKVFVVRRKLAVAHANLDKMEEAEALLLENERRLEALGETGKEWANTLTTLIEFYELCGLTEEADYWRGRFEE